MIIDSHQHFWNFDWLHYAWPTEEEKKIYRNIEASELEPLLKKAGIDKTITVQADDSYADTVYMLDTAEKKDWVAGVVGWVPLNKPDEAHRKLEEFTKNPYFKGVRHLIHMYEDTNWIVKNEVIEGLKVLASFNIPFDFVAIFPDHLNHVPTLAEKIPNLKLVIDHLAKPPIKEKKIEEWALQMSRVAEYPNVYTKVSGLNTAAHWDTWSFEDLNPYLDVAFDLFGANRLMFGSDWPVANLAGGYLKVLNEIKKALGERTKEELDHFFWKTANEFYHLKLENN
ncbi:amidohydrolase family protein [Pullulanibacillus sp. KACC 23026]|uniref:amidohydrolase family protein n=1 Tax=Pullulanibacillus sp. KACC 23026 TaxID=3028315 RepID=UPI0023B0E34D|nr:amidohydrolase family protein [Pullulanibacillus sp. KACC 23026]WEG11729.1 amidohydrolase family protein [Pullulanibacillus sp. KACC 23026]